jgi:pyridoxal phosphate enzyme (YggS family)
MIPPTAVDFDDVAHNVERVRDRIDRAGGAHRVRLIAVTKGFGVDAVRAALAAGISDIGESYMQELEEKVALLGTDVVAPPRWHVIGRLQRNKVRRITADVHLWHTVDRDELADEIARRRPGSAVLIQVNVSDEPQKGGCAPHEAPALVAHARGVGLDVRGLMTIGRAGAPETARPGFRLLSSLADDLGLAERSMGMSDDLDVAVEEGSTMVRVGRGLFGARS